MASPANTTHFLSENGSFQDKNIVIQTPMVTIIPANDGSPAHQAICRCCFVEAPATFKSLRHVKYPLCEKLVININGAYTTVCGNIKHNAQIQCPSRSVNIIPATNMMV